MPHARASRQLQPNRADLTQPSAQAVPNQPYGVAAAQRAAAQAIPMGQPPLGAAPTQTPPQAQPQAAPQQPLAVPGGNGPLTRPTERPNEPVTHGLPMGPGAGPEALQGVGAAARQGAVEQGTLIHLLTSLAAGPNATSAIKDLAARAQSGVM
jgi:hypothetical protein